MILTNRTLYMLGILVLSFWLTFLFVDQAFGTAKPAVIVPETTTIAQALDANDSLVPNEELTWHSVASAVPSIESTPDLVALPTSSTAVESKQSSLADIRLLMDTYDQNKWDDVLVVLIQRLATEYQFDDANRYLQKLMQKPSYEKKLDVRVILYVLFHNTEVSSNDPQAVQSILPVIEQFRSEGLLTKDDYSFYQWLVNVRSQKYSEANKNWASISSGVYTDIVQSYRKAIVEYSGSKNAPVYYQDALVALSMLKNWYFSVAKKLALSALMQNTDYILPYQILAYTNFLSNNWDVSAEYFLKLADFDQTNRDQYMFLVGVSYYRQGEYDQSVLYLNQVQASGSLTDVYRYQLLSSLAMEDADGAIRIRQKLLGQPDLQATDFTQFFTTFFYQPYANGQPLTLYRDNTQLASMYIDVCARVLSGGADACTYGEVWLSLSTATWAWIASKLLYLSSTYHQSFLSHALGDYYFQNKEYDLAKDAYTQALASTTSSNEKILLNDKLQKASRAK